MPENVMGNVNDINDAPLFPVQYLFYFLFLSVLSLFVNGYTINSTDLSLYLSYLPFYSGNSQVYHPQDLFFLAKQTGGNYYTFVGFLLTKCMTLPGLEWTCFSLHILSLIVCYSAIYLLATRVYDEKAAWLVILCLIAKKHAGGSVVSLLDNTFGIRNLAFPFLISAILFGLIKDICGQVY